MIRVGKRGISGIFLGTIPIRAVYLGTNLLYEENSSRLIKKK